MGSGIFKGGLTNHRSLAENLPIVEEKWELSNGCFGKHPKGNHRLVTDIESEDQLKQVMSSMIKWPSVEKLTQFSITMDR